MVNCSPLAHRADFNTYAHKLLNVTDGDLHKVSQCKTEVCGALWGTGNGDISGIGMIVGYIIDHILGLALSAAVLLAVSRRSTRLQEASRTCLESFSFCATFFAFSIEIAALVVLIREEFGINTSGMGDYTVRITQAVAMVILLPLLYPILTFMVKSTRSSTLRRTPGSSDQNIAEDKTASARFGLLVVCWALAFYPFFSRMNNAFGESKIRKHTTSNNSVITPKQFGIIEEICLGDNNRITRTEDNLTTAFIILAYIPLSLFVLGRILWLGVERNHPNSKLHRRLKRWSESAPTGIVTAFPLVAFVWIPLVACGLLWSIIRTQQLQENLTASYRGYDSDNYWTFGQIVAVTIFAPVLIECWNSFVDLRTESSAAARPDEDTAKLEKRASGDE